MAREQGKRRVAAQQQLNMEMGQPEGFLPAITTSPLPAREQQTPSTNLASGVLGRSRPRADPSFIVRSTAVLRSIQEPAGALRSPLAGGHS